MDCYQDISILSLRCSECFLVCCYAVAREFWVDESPDKSLNDILVIRYGFGPLK